MPFDPPSVLDRTLDLIASALRSQQLVMQREVWARNSANRAFLLAFIESVGGYPTKTAEDQRGAIELLNRTNASVHFGRRTPGLARQKPEVIIAQGGEYCRICGTRSADLQVDHIEPAALRGSDEIQNLQLLCPGCNQGKSNTLYGRLAAALETRKDATLSDALRYLRLSLSSTVEQGRPLGRCDCGSLARDVVLAVASRRDAAANLLNLKVSCANCEG